MPELEFEEELPPDKSGFLYGHYELSADQYALRPPVRQYLKHVQAHPFFAYMHEDGSASQISQGQWPGTEEASLLYVPGDPSNPWYFGVKEEAGLPEELVHPRVKAIAGKHLQYFPRYAQVEVDAREGEDRKTILVPPTEWTIFTNSEEV